MAGVIRLKQLIEHTGLSRSAIYDRMDEKSPRHDPAFPTSFSLGGKAVGWRKEEVDSWLSKCATEPKQKSRSTTEQRASERKPKRGNEKRLSIEQAPPEALKTIDPVRSKGDMAEVKSLAETASPNLLGVLGPWAVETFHDWIQPQQEQSKLPKQHQDSEAAQVACTVSKEPSQPQPRAPSPRHPKRLICLDDVINALAVRIEITDDEAAKHLSPNMQGTTRTLAEAIKLGAQKRFMARAQAAGILIELIGSSAEENPALIDLTRLHPLIKSSAIDVSQEGLNILLSIQKQAWEPKSPKTQDRWQRPETETSAIFTEPQPLPREFQIGFYADELISVLDGKGIPHALGAAECNLTAPRQDSTEGNPTPELARCTRHVITRAGRTSSIKDAVLEAQELAGGETAKPGAVWSRLHKMAESGEHAALRLSARGEIERLEETWGVYTKKALQQFLARRRSKNLARP